MSINVLNIIFMGEYETVTIYNIYFYLPNVACANACSNAIVKIGNIATISHFNGHTGTQLLYNEYMKHLV